MTETILVILIMALAVILAARTVWRTLTGKQPGCGCAKFLCPRQDCDLDPPGEPPPAEPEQPRSDDP